MSRISTVDNSSYKITVHQPERFTVGYINSDAEVQLTTARCNAKEADVIMNRVAKGLIDTVDSGVVICWRAESALDDYFVHRVVEFSVAVDDPIEYIVHTRADEHNAELAFLVAVNKETGKYDFVRDVMAVNPFADEFGDGYIFHFTELNKMDAVIQRGYVSKVMQLFSDMFAGTHDVHQVWTTIKE